MSNYILKYSKGEEVKYISHLDFVRTFARAVRRSGLAVTYSNGFNPHPVMSVAAPISVGVTGEGEYLRIGFDEPYSEEEIVEKLGRAMPIGIKIIAAKEQKSKNEYNFASVKMADYEVYAETNFENLDIAGFYTLDEIIIPKKSKSGVRDSDIKPLLYSIRSEKTDGGYMIYMRTAAGESNLRPDTVIESMKKYIGGFECEYFRINRKALLTEEGKELL